MAMISEKEIPRRDTFISAAVLKHIAYVSMLTDHFFYVVFWEYIQWKSWQGFETDYLVKVYQWGREFGRIAFILFAFLVTEGFTHTHDRKKYLWRLGIFALLSEIPFDLAIFGKLFTLEGQNVFFTLFFGVLALYFIEEFQGYFLLQILAVTASCVLAILLDTDYMIMGVLLIGVLYLCRKSFWQQMVAGATIMYFGTVMNYVISYWNDWEYVMQFFEWGKTEMYGMFAFILIYFYNGKKGKQTPKMVYYLFYPIHLLLLYALKETLFG